MIMEDREREREGGMGRERERGLSSAIRQRIHTEVREMSEEIKNELLAIWNPLNPQTNTSSKPYCTAPPDYEISFESAYFDSCTPPNKIALNFHLICCSYNTKFYVIDHYFQH